MLIIPAIVAAESPHPLITSLHDQEQKKNGDLSIREVSVYSEDITDELLHSLHGTAEQVRHKGFTRGVEALLSTRSGTPRSCPGRWVVGEMLSAYINANSPVGWVFRTDDLSYQQAYRYEGVKLQYDGTMHLKLRSYNAQSHMSATAYIEIDPPTGLPSTILGRHGLTVATAELIKQYHQQARHAVDLATKKPGHQVLYSGVVSTWSRPLQKMVFTNVASRKMVIETHLTDEDRAGFPDPDSGFDLMPCPYPAPEGQEPDLPLKLHLEAFDLTAEQKVTIGAPGAASYVYDDTMKDKIILPATHRRVIDTLTSVTESTLTDIVHGKGAGNLILAKGKPGLGKTLTPEVVAETLHRPLYVVDASSIITDSDDSLRTKMDEIFARVRKWDAVLLLDEADVILGRRDNDLNRNRITAELLRTLESFERIAFLTTNRPDDIDDAILSRCVAIIEYQPPAGADAERTWMVLGEQIKPDLVDQAMAEILTEQYPLMPPRDMRQLLRLAYQVAIGDKREFTPELIADCAVFRAWKPAA